MAYEFTKLSEVTSVSEFPDGAKVLIESGGQIKRCATSGLSGVDVIIYNNDGAISIDGLSFTQAYNRLMNLHPVTCAFMEIIDDYGVGCKPITNLWAYDGDNSIIITVGSSSFVWDASGIVAD